MTGRADALYRTCPRCGAHLDPGERCDCRGHGMSEARQSGPGIRGRPRPAARKTMEDEAGIFYIRACRCKRCGGMLTSKQGLRYGYGSRCRRIVEETHQERVSGVQTTIPGFDWSGRRESVAP